MRSARGGPGVTTRVVALGDSLSCGEGVGINTGPLETWVALLTAAVPEGELTQLAVAGAGIAQVRREQLPRAVRARPDIATVLVGLNDSIRLGFGIQGFRADLEVITGKLAAGGATVLLCTLHDPAVLRPLSLPPRVHGRLADRVREVNAVVRQVAAAHPRACVVDLAAIAGLRRLGAWEVDRVHPAPAGHRLIARAALDRLTGYATAPIDATLLPEPPRWPARLSWVLRCGIPWLVQHGASVVPAAVLMSRGGSGGGQPLDPGGHHQPVVLEPPLVEPPPRRPGAGSHQLTRTPEVAGARR